MGGSTRSGAARFSKESGSTCNGTARFIKESGSTRKGTTRFIEESGSTCKGTARFSYGAGSTRSGAARFRFGARSSLSFSFLVAVISWPPSGLSAREFDPRMLVLPPACIFRGSCAAETGTSSPISEYVVLGALGS